MSETNDSLAKEKEILKSVENAPTSKKLLTYTKLSGPGWLQGAITLGGGSLGGSLYLGIIGGTELLWLQPMMMIFGIIMLSVIGYVTLSTGKKPFQAINEHINPVLGWGWLIAAMLANLVWAMPQFSLGTAAMTQNLNLLPDGDTGKYIGAVILFTIGTLVVLIYDSKWAKYFDVILKVMVGIVVVSFFGVVAVMASELNWGAVFSGFIPNPSLLSQPVSGLQPFIEASSDSEYWTNVVMSTQKDKMIAAAATAVGINMTFLLPYSMLRKGWGREHRGLASFDLGIGLFVPFFLATTCVMIAAASQFHGKFNEGLIDPNSEREVPGKIQKAYDGNLEKFNAHLKVQAEKSGGALKEPTIEDKKMAAMLVNRDAFQLANSLEKLTGNKTISQTVFGIGVLGMAVSTIIILMLINGFCLSEAFGTNLSGPVHKIGSVLPGITGALGYLFIWGKGNDFLLTIPTSVFGMVLLPVAYFTFFCMVNSKSLLGEDIPKGGKRVALNIAMGFATVAATIGAWVAIKSKTGDKAIFIVGGFLLLVLIGHFYRKSKQDAVSQVEDKSEE